MLNAKAQRIKHTILYVPNHNLHMMITFLIELAMNA